MANNNNSEPTWGDLAYDEGLKTPQNKPTRPADTNAPKRPTKTKHNMADPATAAVAKKLDFGNNPANKNPFAALGESE